MVCLDTLPVDLEPGHDVLYGLSNGLTHVVRDMRPHRKAQKRACCLLGQGKLAGMDAKSVEGRLKVRRHWVMNQSPDASVF